MNIHKKISFELLTRKLEKLPTLSPIVLKLLELLSNEQATVDELEEVILQDQSIAAKIISVANSAYFGYPGRVTSISEAIIRVLGFKMVKSLALSFSLFNSFAVEEDDKHSFQLIEFWKHTFAVATVSQYLVRQGKLPLQSDTVFISGLLHDIGIVALNKLFRKEYDGIASLAISKHIPLREAEVQFFSVDHQEVGRILSQRWHLPKIITDVIQYHHFPETFKGGKQSYQAVCLIHLADNLVKELNVGYCGDVEFNENDMRIVEELGLELGEEEIEKLQEEMHMAVEVMETLMGG